MLLVYINIINIIIISDVMILSMYIIQYTLCPVKCKLYNVNRVQCTFIYNIRKNEFIRLIILIYTICYMLLLYIITYRYRLPYQVDLSRHINISLANII